MATPTTRPRRPAPRPGLPLPRLTLGHVLIATAVAAAPLALIGRASRDMEGGIGAVLVAVFATAAVLQVEVAFWFVFGPAIHRRLVPRRDGPTGGSAGIHWVEEATRAGVVVGDDVSKGSRTPS